MRVMEVVRSLARGGAEQVAATLARKLDRKRFQVQLVALYDPGPHSLAPELEGSGVHYITLGKRPGLDPRMWSRLARVFRRYAPSIVHTHSAILPYVWPVAAVAGKARIVHTVHNLARKETGPLGRALNRVFLRTGVVPVAVGRSVAESFVAVYGRPVCRTILNGIDLDRFRLGREEGVRWRRQHGFGPDDLLVVSIARLDPQKDPLALLRAFRAGLGDQDRSHLIFVGRGALEEELRRLVGVYGLGSRVHFLGVREDVPEILSAADVFALSSRWEGFPISVLEAMASGLPVLSTRVGGLPELVEPEVHGLLVPPGDVQALGEAMSRLAKDRELRARMSAAARARAAQFEAARMVREYEDLFLSLESTG